MTRIWKDYERMWTALIAEGQASGDFARGGDAKMIAFGILALQMDFITRDQLVAAMNAWVLDKVRPLGEVMQDQGALPADRLEIAFEHAGARSRKVRLHATGSRAEKLLAAIASL